MPKLKSDVTVIGAGPAGSTTARTIARHGFDVILVEKDEYPGKTNVCAAAIPKSIIKDMGLSSDVVKKEILREDYYYPWGMKDFELNHIASYRNIFDRSLADKAVEGGVKMLTDTSIKDATVKSDWIRVISEGNGNVIESKLVVFADGPNTLAYRKFGIGFRPEMDKTSVSVMCEVEWKDNPLDHFELHYGHDLSPWGYGWLCPKEDTVNVGVLCLYSKYIESSSNLIKSLNYMLKRPPLTAEKLKGRKCIGLSSALLPAAPAKQIFGERMLVVGDAAGMVDPVSGEGIRHAITGGKLAGEVCVNALDEDDFSSMFLSQYQRLWHKTPIYSYIYGKYLLSNVFLYLYKIDRNAYPKLAAITRGGIKKVFNTLKFIYLNR